MPSITFKEAQRRYVRILAPVMTFYVIFSFAGPIALQYMTEPPVWAVSLVAIITALPIIVVFWLMTRFLRGTDEYYRKIQTDAILIGGAITLSLSVAWGFLELYQVAPRHDYLPSMMLTGPLFFAMWGLVYIFQAIQRK